MKAYLEYLELFDYFGRQGAVRLGRDEFLRLDGEFGDSAKRAKLLGPAESARLGELKAILFRDKPEGF